MVIVLELDQLLKILSKSYVKYVCMHTPEKKICMYAYTAYVTYYKLQWICYACNIFYICVHTHTEFGEQGFF